MCIVQIISSQNYSVKSVKNVHRPISLKQSFSTTGVCVYMWMNTNHTNCEE